MEKPVRLYLVRHGQTALNRDDRFRGLTDAPLTGLGRLEAAGAGAVLDGSGVSVVHSSPIPRALETARIIADLRGARVEPEESFTDIDYGEWQGLTVEEVARRSGPHMLEFWKRDPAAFVFPGGDSMHSVRERVGPALKRVVSAEDEGVAVVSHLAVLKVCFLVAMELPFEYFWKVGLGNGSVSLFTHTREGGFVLEWWNRAPGVAPD